MTGARQEFARALARVQLLVQQGRCRRAGAGPASPSRAATSSCAASTAGPRGFLQLSNGPSTRSGSEANVSCNSSSLRRPRLGADLHGVPSGEAVASAHRDGNGVFNDRRAAHVRPAHGRVVDAACNGVSASPLDSAARSRRRADGRRGRFAFCGVSTSGTTPSRRRAGACVRAGEPHGRPTQWNQNAYFRHPVRPPAAIEATQFFVTQHTTTLRTDPDRPGSLLVNKSTSGGIADAERRGVRRFGASRLAASTSHRIPSGRASSSTPPPKRVVRPHGALRLLLTTRSGSDAASSSWSETGVAAGDETAGLPQGWWSGPPSAPSTIHSRTAVRGAAGGQRRNRRSDRPGRALRRLNANTRRARRPCAASPKRSLRRAGEEPRLGWMHPRYLMLNPDSPRATLDLPASTSGSRSSTTTAATSSRPRWSVVLVSGNTGQVRH